MTPKAKEQHKIVRNRERCWNTYKLESNWRAYTKGRNIYNRLLVYNKHHVLSEKVNNMRGDTQALYKLTTNLMGSDTSNPMPKGKSDEELADQFASYFVEKIDKIRKLFNDTPAYNSVTSDIPRLRKFSPLTEKQVKSTMMSMQSKSCELDPIPTTLLKRLMDKCLPIITKIVNISLTQGVFSVEWKTSIVRPLLKKAGLELINKNYRLVSNLTFISKLVEK